MILQETHKINIKLQSYRLLHAQLLTKYSVRLYLMILHPKIMYHFTYETIPHISEIKTIYSVTHTLHLSPCTRVDDTWHGHGCMDLCMGSKSNSHHILLGNNLVQNDIRPHNNLVVYKLRFMDDSFVSKLSFDILLWIPKYMISV